jgi:hypothetical protein
LNACTSIELALILITAAVFTLVAVLKAAS